MSFQDLIGLLAACRPDRKPSVGPRGDHAAVLEERNGVDGSRMIPQHLARRVGLQRPADGGRIEAARQQAVAVSRNSERPDGAAVARKLRVRR